MSKSLLFHCVIPGRCYVKKNTKRVYGSGRRKRVVYSEQFQFWEKVAELTLLKARSATITEPVELCITFHFKTHRAEPDVSNLVEGPQDVLEKVGIIKNDKIIQRVVAEKLFGTDYEKTTIEIFEYTPRQ